MVTVWKYPVTIIDDWTISLPAGAQVLTVANQGEQACLWALVDPSQPTTERRRFRIAGTGHPIGTSDDLRYINTFQLMAGALVFHLFEVVGSVPVFAGEASGSPHRSAAQKISSSPSLTPVDQQRTAHEHD
jgi:hypothetical protein